MQVTDEMVRAAQQAADSRNCMVTEATMRAALTAALAAMWRPIEEVPKDGTWLMLFDCIHKTAVIGKYRYDARPPGKYGRFIWFLQEDAGVLAENSVTHYMPLPSPPTQTGG